MRPTKLTTRHLREGPLHPRHRPSRAAVLALGAALLASACGQATPSGSPAAVSSTTGSSTTGSSTTGSSTTGSSPGGSGPARQTVTAGGVRLEAELAPGGAGVAPSSGLLVDYSLTNPGSTPVVAYDVVPDDLGSATLAPHVDPRHAWVYADSGVLRISKQGFATAANVRFAAAPVMGGHVVAPGATITGRAYAATPPRLDVPGESFQAPRTAVEPAVRRWQLCIQVDDRAGQARPSAVGGGVVEAPSVAPQGDQLVCTEPATIPVP